MLVLLLSSALAFQHTASTAAPLPVLGEKPLRVRVEAGDLPRKSSLVAMEVAPPEPGALATPAIVVQEVDSGREWPGQYLVDGPSHSVVWVVENLKANEKRAFDIRIGAEQPPRFRWEDEPGIAMTLFGPNDKPILRYEYAAFDPARIEETKKPYHHVFHPGTGQRITKGLGGLYPHHRGIFLGYSKCRVNGKLLDTWHAKNGEHQVHREVLASYAGPVLAGHIVAIDWNDREGKAFIHETRGVVAIAQPDDSLLLECSAMLTSATGEAVRLDGDKQHAGLQFRAEQEVADKQKESRYLRPAKWAEYPQDKEFDAPEFRDVPWNALQFRLGEQPYTVVYLSHPTNPRGGEFSERLYGRFGEFIPFELNADHPSLILQARLWIVPTHDVDREAIENRHDDFSAPPRVVVE